MLCRKVITSGHCERSEAILNVQRSRLPQSLLLLRNDFNLLFYKALETLRINTGKSVAKRLYLN